VTARAHAREDAPEARRIRRRRTARRLPLGSPPGREGGCSLRDARRIFVATNTRLENAARETARVLKITATNRAAFRRSPFAVRRSPFAASSSFSAADMPDRLHYRCPGRNVLPTCNRVHFSVECVGAARRRVLDGYRRSRPIVIIVIGCDPECFPYSIRGYQRGQGTTSRIYRELQGSGDLGDLGDLARLILLFTCVSRLARGAESSFSRGRRGGSDPVRVMAITADREESLERKNIRENSSRDISRSLETASFAEHSRNIPIPARGRFQLR